MFCNTLMSLAEYIFYNISFFLLVCSRAKKQEFQSNFCPGYLSTKCCVNYKRFCCCSVCPLYILFLKLKIGLNNVKCIHKRGWIEVNYCPYILREMEPLVFLSFKINAELSDNFALRLRTFGISLGVEKCRPLRNLGTTHKRF